VVPALLPVVALLILYGRVLRAWFQFDDFAWLSLRNTLANGRSIWWALFSPQAQGTIRPLSERLYFLAFSHGVTPDPLPFRIMALLTVSVCAVLIVHLAQRTGASPWTPCFVGLLWVSNPNLAVPLVWASAYNQALYSLFVLTGLIALMRYLKQHRPIDLVLLWASLILALGANESGIVLSAIAVLYITIFDRRSSRLAASLTAFSAAYVVIHIFVASVPHSGPYAFDLGLRPAISSFASYWLLVLGLTKYEQIHGISPLLPNLAAVMIAAALLAALLVCAHRRNWMPVFWFGMYVLTLAPVVAFPQHVMDYYLFLPSAALALTIAAVLDEFRASRRVAVPVLTAALIYSAAVTIPTARFVCDWNVERSLQVRARAEAVLQAASELRARYPSANLYLQGLDDEQYWVAFCYGSLAKKALQQIYLAPGAQKDIREPPPEWCSMKYQPENARASGDATSVVLNIKTGRTCYTLTPCKDVRGSEVQ